MLIMIYLNVFNKIYYKDYVTLSGSGRTSKNRFWYADIK